MKASVRVLLCGLLLAGAAVAQTECEKALEALRSSIAPDSGASWDDMYKAYNAVQKHVQDHEDCKKAYKAMQPEVARALRRESVPWGGWLMGIFGALLLWGGMIFCIGVAMKSGKSGTEPD